MKYNNNKIKCIVFDLDGTIYFGKELAEKANEVITHCRNKYPNIYFATNNSAITKNDVYKRLINMGISVNESEVLNTTYIIAEYLSKNDYKNVYCLGSDGLKKEIIQKGINPESNSPEAIVIGYDIDFSLNKLEKAINVYNKNCKIIVSNKERTYPRDKGIITPGAGAAVSAFEYTVNAKSDILIGKPETTMLKIISEKLNLTPKEILVIGDSIESDIEMAKRFNCDSILISQCADNYDGNKINKLKELLEIL